MSAARDGVVLGDWGTTRLRLFLCQSGGVRGQCEGPGIGAVGGNAAGALLDCLAAWRARCAISQVWLCGMAGSRNGLLEVPYLSLPLGVDEWIKGGGTLETAGLTIRIAAGVAARNALDAPDVMRGEETQAFGALNLDGSLAVGRQLLLLPGTHSKWAVLEQGMLRQFTTFMTGELFALLREHSTLLRAAAALPAAGAVAGPQAGFRDGLARVLPGGSALAAMIFETRTAQLLEGRSPDWAREFLSGALIGAEVAAALEANPAARRVTIIGAPALTSRYRQALQQRGIEAAELDGDRCALAGLARLSGLDIREQ